MVLVGSGIIWYGSGLRIQPFFIRIQIQENDTDSMDPPHWVLVILVVVALLMIFMLVLVLRLVCIGCLANNLHDGVSFDACSGCLANDLHVGVSKFFVNKFVMFMLLLMFVVMLMANILVPVPTVMPFRFYFKNRLYFPLSLCKNPHLFPTQKVPVG